MSSVVRSKMRVGKEKQGERRKEGKVSFEARAARGFQEEVVGELIKKNVALNIQKQQTRYKLRRGLFQTKIPILCYYSYYSIFI